MNPNRPQSFHGAPAYASNHPAPTPVAAAPVGGWAPAPLARPLLVTLYRSGLVQLNKAAAGAVQAMNTALRVNLVQSDGEWYLVRRDNPLDNALSYTFGGPAKFRATKPVRAFFEGYPGEALSVQCRLEQVPAKKGLAFRLVSVEIVENEF